MAKEDIVTREVSYPGDACPLKAYVAEPAAAESSPAVIVVQEWWGLNDHIRDVARRLAREGYFAIARICTRGRDIKLPPNPTWRRN